MRVVRGVGESLAWCFLVLLEAIFNRKKYLFAQV